MTGATERGLTKASQEEVKALQLEIQQITRQWSVLNTNQIQKIFNTTPRKYKMNRPAKGGGKWTYVRKSYVRKVLDGVFGFDWDFIPETAVQEAYEVAKVTGSVVVKGTLICRVRNDKGKIVTALKKSDYGRKEVAFKKATTGDGAREPLDFGNDLKAASSDCLKRCAALFGIAADVYEPEEFQEIDIIGSDQNEGKRKRQEELIKAAQPIIDTPAVEVEDTHAR